MWWRAWLKSLTGYAGGFVTLVAIGEAFLMLSPFAGFFYGGYRPALDFLSDHRATAWLNGFFLNHALITTSGFLEGQRLVGKYLFAVAIWLFLLGFLQIYVAKLIRWRGVQRYGLYMVVRHPQYLCLILAGWGLLTIWPRFFLLVLWVTMIFLYILLARFEERRLEERFPGKYEAFRKVRGGFLPWSPGEKLYSLTFGRIPVQPLGFALCYLFCLGVAIAAGFGTRAWVKARTCWTVFPEERAAALVVWPREEAALRRIVRRVLDNPAVLHRTSREGDDAAFVVHVLPRDYGMFGMYATMSREQPEPTREEKIRRLKMLTGRFLMPKEPRHGEFRIIGTNIPRMVVVVSRARKRYRDVLSVEEVLDAGVKLEPLVVLALHAHWEDVPIEHAYPARRNAWGDLTTPIF